MVRKSEQPYRGKANLSVLFGDDEPQASNERVSLASISLSSNQPRRYFDPQKMDQLVQSVEAHGILENLLIRPLPGEENRYELVAGERRYRAAEIIGLEEVPVTIRQLTDEEALQIALVENLQREDLNPIEETEGIIHLLGIRLSVSKDEVISLLYRMQNDVARLTDNVILQPQSEAVKEVFAGLGLMEWESFVSNRLPLLRLPEVILEAIRQGKLAYTKAQVITRVKDEESRKTLLEEAIAQELSLAQIKDRINNLKAACPGEDQVSPIKDRVKSVINRFQKAKIWNNPKKHKKLERLLMQMEALLTEE